MRDDILIRFIAGEATLREREAVLRWRAESEEHASRLRALEEAWKHAGAALAREPAPKSGRADKALLYVRLRMNDRGTAPSPGRQSGALHGRPTRRFPLRAAAGIGLLAAGLAGVALWSSAPRGEGRVFSTVAGQKADVRFPDGTRATLAPETRLTVAPRYAAERREVRLQGRAIFDVAPMRDAPFLVHTDGPVAQALGTVFDVRAYPEEDDVRVVVVEGAVRVGADTREDQRTLRLEADQLGIYRARDGRLTREPVDAQRQTAWARDRLLFDDAQLEIVLRELERWYGIPLGAESRELLDLRFSGEFRFESLREIIDVVAYTLDLGYTRQADTVVFRRP